jgi:hypothetical protein
MGASRGSLDNAHRTRPPILRSAQATTVPRRGTETMAIGRRPPSSRSEAGVSQRFAASSELHTNDTWLIVELQPNSRASPKHRLASLRPRPALAILEPMVASRFATSVRMVAVLGASTALLGYGGRRYTTIIDAVPKVTQSEQPHDPTAADERQGDFITQHQGARDRLLVPILSAGADEVRKVHGRPTHQWKALAGSNSVVCSWKRFPQGVTRGPAHRCHLLRCL